MLVALAAALPALPAPPTRPPVRAECSWSAPGADPFMGDLVAAVDHYQDIPPQVRAALKQRMRERRYDDLVEIQRDAIRGRSRYDGQIRDMHFGGGAGAAICRRVHRSRWLPAAVERGLVYCEAGHCLLVPTVCRNLSRVQRLDDERRAARQGGSEAVGEDGAPPLPVTAVVDGSGPIDFDAPGAGWPARAELPPLDEAEPWPGAAATATPPPDALAAEPGSFAAAPSAVPVLYAAAGALPPLRSSPLREPVAPATGPLPLLTSVVPEPAAWSALLLGLGLLGAWRTLQARGRVSRG